MHGVSLVRFIVGIVGNIVSFGLFLSPVTTIWSIWKNKSIMDFHPYPYLAAFMNCILWIFYGMPFVHPDSTLVITINSVGLALEIIYIIIFMIYANKKYRTIIPLFILCELVLFAIIVAVSLLVFHTTTDRSMLVGIICDVAGIIMYISPLSTLKHVIETKNAESMQFWLCLSGFLNGGIWFCYAFLKKFDPYIAAGNGIGGLFGAIQLLVYAFYYLKAKNNVANDDGKRSDLQWKISQLV
ncbi:bidirectional sugar transporter SWEET5-like [Salvia divinorum]|uniref:Bidirectional sugar transporter SWEET n=1 Tax=Salvia divinorum TaxID=28513 RepID=A0ABD1G390_SALDI